MKSSRRILFGLLFILWAASTCQAQSAFLLKDGDRVVFYGDSITAQRLYTRFTETYVVTRFPRLNITFIHSGWGGDRVTGGAGGDIETRLQRDVIAYKPTVMTIMLGMNDGGYRLYDAGLFQTYSTGYRHIIQEMKTALPSIRITAIEPSPFDDVTHPPQFEGGYNGVLKRYSQFVAELSRDEHLTLADLNAPVVSALEKANAADPQLASRVIPDRVHPSAAGHWIMAESLLKAWNAPAVVTDVELDAATPAASHTENTSVSDLKKENGLSWTQSDKALPLPINLRDKALALMVQSSDIIQALDQEPLRVTGLAPGRYQLMIDGENVGSYSAEEMAAGIDLAILDTPMTRQARAVDGLTGMHNDLHASRWQNLQVPFAGAPLPHYLPGLEMLDTLESEIVDRQRAAAQPAPHHYELRIQ